MFNQSNNSPKLLNQNYVLGTYRGNSLVQNDGEVQNFYNYRNNKSIYKNCIIENDSKSLEFYNKKSENYLSNRSIFLPLLEENFDNASTNKNIGLTFQNKDALIQNKLLLGSSPLLIKEEVLIYKIF